MAYPSDSGTTYTTKSNGQIIDASDVNNLQTEVTALKTKVGTNGDTNNASHDYKLSEVTSTDKSVGKTATQTLTNKTLTSPTVTTPTITTPVINGNPTGTFVTAIANGGTGQTTASNAINALVPTQTSNSGKFLTTNGTVVSWQSASDSSKYGDGSDGDVTISGNTTLTRDMFYNTLTVNSGVTLTTASYRIFAKVSVTNNGAIVNNGNNGSAGTQGGDQASDGNGTAGTAGTGGTAIATGTLKGSIAGVDGSVGQVAGTNSNAGNGLTGTAETYGTSSSNGAAGGNGGAGAKQGGATGNGGTGGSGGTTTRISKIATTEIAISPYIASNFLGGLAGSGSGAGGGGATWNGFTASCGGGGGGGGSGSNGGMIVIVSPVVTVSATGSITANGGNGGNGGRGGNATGGTSSRNLGGGGGGGGAGGNGGVIAIISPSYTNSGTVTANGGSAGTGGAAGTGSSGNGTAGSNGTAGNAGYIVNII